MSEDSERIYTIEVTERQAAILSRACELLSRLGMGQFGEAVLWEHLDDAKKAAQKDGDENSWGERVHSARETFRQAGAHLVGMAPHSYRGILSEDTAEVFKIAWDLHKVLRNRLAWDRNPEGGIQVDFDPPGLVRGSRHPMARIEQKSET